MLVAAVAVALFVNGGASATTQQADSPAVAAELVHFCHYDFAADRCGDPWYSLSPTGPCRNIPKGTPWTFVFNESSQGQWFYSDFNCRSLPGTEPVALSPSTGFNVAWGTFRSYKHT